MKKYSEIEKEIQDSIRGWQSTAPTIEAEKMALRSIETGLLWLGVMVHQEEMTERFSKMDETK